MTSFAISKEKNQWLKEKMEALNIHEKDIKEKFVRSSGKGGQKVNKTSSCVYLRHIPTGIEVKCMKDRSQSVNRFLARRELVGRMEALFRLSGSPTGSVTGRVLKMEKIRKQKGKRRKRAKIKYDVTAETA